MDGRSSFREGLRSVIGDVTWQAPAWFVPVQGRARRAWTWTRDNPQQVSIVASVAFVLLVAGLGVWRWYGSQPKPVTVDVELSAPGRTCYECEPPRAPEPITIRFQASAAPLSAIGKPLDAAAAGLQLSPAAEGNWTWLDLALHFLGELIVNGKRDSLFQSRRVHRMRET